MNRSILSSQDSRSISPKTLLFVVLLAALGLYVGWRLFWFLTDDAYIAFRYISNSRLGYGYTWNPPPFRAVEGYTSFLWVLLLDVIWRLTEMEPSYTANFISLLFAFGTIMLGISMLIKLFLSDRLESVRLPIMIIVIVGLLTNRTFLAWTSSGLETAMFNFFVTAWVYACLMSVPYTPRWVLWVTVTAVLCTLTRPDGLLFIMATLFLIVMTFLTKRNDRASLWRTLAASLPLLAIVAHLLWRRQKYGEWVPNTYAAKYVAPWPESGWRYLLSFVMEYSLWIWFGLVIVFAVYQLRRLNWEAGKTFVQDFTTSWRPPQSLVAFVVVVTLLLHAGYYTFIIGGDHFEYRVYSQLILLLFLSVVWILNALDVSPGLTILILAIFVIMSWPLQWSHWMATQELTTRDETEKLQAPIAAYFPAFAQPYIQLFDEIQFWLISRNVANRHQEHKIFHEYQLSIYPDRLIGALLSAESYPVKVSEAVGVPSWMLPTTNIIDALGLNDYVVARNQTIDAQHRAMAHDRRLPEGYAECFRPNVQVIMGRKVVLKERELTANDIIDCENKHWSGGSADKNILRTLGIDHINASAVDTYLWGGRPPGNLFFHYVPSDVNNAGSNEQLLNAFSEYNGLGCIIVPPLDNLGTRDDFLFAFFDSQNRPSLSELSQDFPWLKQLDVSEKDPPDNYHLAYSAAAGRELEPLYDQERLAAWANGIDLVNYEAPSLLDSAEDTLFLTLVYRTNRPLEAGKSSFVHLVGEAFNPSTEGPLWGQYDSDPCREFYPMELWPQGATVISKAAIQIPPNIPAGGYELRTGFYEWQTGNRIRLTEGDGTENSWIVPGGIHIEPSPKNS